MDEEQEVTDVTAGRNLEPPPDDFWTITRDCLTIHHRNPRTRLYVPTSDDCPLPLKYLDVMRNTTTNLEDATESYIHDLWPAGGNSEQDRELSYERTGTTSFDLLRPQAPRGHKWVEGRLTRMQESTRPDNVLPEAWTGMSKKQKKKAREACK